MEKKILTESAIFVASLLMLVFCCLAFTGCSHNTGTFFAGTRYNAGLDPQNATANLSYDRGVSIVDVSRENSSWDISIDSTAGIGFDEKSGRVTGIESVKREVGPQITGYLVELSKTNPEAVIEYMRAVDSYWKYRARETPEAVK